MLRGSVAGIALRIAPSRSDASTRLSSALRCHRPDRWVQRLLVGSRIGSAGATPFQAPGPGGAAARGRIQDRVGEGIRMPGPETGDADQSAVGPPVGVELPDAGVALIPA